MHLALASRSFTPPLCDGGASSDTCSGDMLRGSARERRGFVREGVRGCFEPYDGSTWQEDTRAWPLRAAVSPLLSETAAMSCPAVFEGYAARLGTFGVAG